MKELKVLVVAFLSLSAVIAFSFSMGVLIDYYEGTARASILKKQTGVEYTWREAAQIKKMYDQNNIRIVF